MNRITFILITFLITTTNLFASFAGTITASKGNASVLREGNSQKVHIGLKLQTKDHILTKGDAKVQIIFKDETIITVGKNSNFSIEEFLFDDENEPSAKFGMFGGAMRAITGKIGKIAPQKFSVTTKTATIGIRGTNFTIATNDAGRLEAYCTYGEISVSVNGEAYSVKQGFFAVLNGNNGVEIKAFTPQELKSMQEHKFGVSQNKNSQVSKGGDVVVNESNDKQLDLTIDDKTEVTIKDVTQESSDTLFKARTLDSTIAGYSMEDATYLGNYTMSENHSILDNSGDTKLSINFSKDTALLEVGSFQNESSTFQYQFENVNKSQVNGNEINGGLGSATMNFYGPAGKTVTGDFIHDTQAEVSRGTYSVQTFENLH